jgi:expansin
VTRALVVALAACISREPAPDPVAVAGEPACAPARAPVRGTATHYATDGTGKCSFDAGDRYVAAASPADYARGALCGACLVVTGPDDSEIVVRVTDSCPACKPGTLDLGRDAFALLAPLARGRIPITWQVVPCEGVGSIAYRFKDKSSAFWAAIQPRNHRYPIATLAVRERDGSFRELPRADYNYFVTTRGLGTGPYTLRATDTRGHSVETTGIALGEAVTRETTSQFPLCR